MVSLEYQLALGVALSQGFGILRVLSSVYKAIDLLAS